jgi:hypothetical protein
LVRRRKAGQAEDVFADLIPGLIIIIITIFIIGVTDITHTKSVKLAADKGMKELYAFDRLTFLRSPVDMSKYDKSLTGMTVADLLVASGDSISNNAKPAWLSYNIVSSSAQCGDEMRKIIESTVGEYAFEWKVKVTDGSSVVFLCEDTSILDEATKIAPFLVPVPGVGLIAKVGVKYGVSVLLGTKLVDYVTDTNYVLPSKVKGNFKVNIWVKFFGFE